MKRYSKNLWAIKKNGLFIEMHCRSTKTINYIKRWMNLFFTYESIVVYVIQNKSVILQLPAFHLMRMLPCKRIRRTKLALGCAAKKDKL